MIQKQDDNMDVMKTLNVFESADVCVSLSAAAGWLQFVSSVSERHACVVSSVLLLPAVFSQ